MTAVGDETTTIVFTTDLDTMNRVATAGDRDGQTVPLAQIDAPLDGCAPALIKMDVEGYETPALRGGEKTPNSPSLIAVILETVDGDAHAQLLRHGFEKAGNDPWTRPLVNAAFAIGSNLLFVRDREKVEERVVLAPRRMVSGSYV